MSNVHLDVVDDLASSVARDGTRNYVHPADVRGPFVKARYVVYAVLIAIWATLPWIPINGRPAVFLDVPARRFYLFGSSFNAQDFWLVFFLLTGVGLTLFVVTTVLGRVWCGWACPQTVFLEGVFRRVERWIEGPRNVRIRRNNGPWTVDKAWRKVLKHAIFVLSALVISHIFLSFFVSMPSLLQMVQGSPAEHPTAFTWMAAFSVILYFNFAWFREQLCLIICPYGRLQSALTDRDSLVVGYDRIRGEPRGKAKDPNAGDCVDCGRCVAVCPTGIDIRNGLQLDCVGCTACIDACDEVMTKLKRPKGLVRYDSERGLDHEKRRLIRPRLFLYAGVIAVWAIAAGFALSGRTTFEANLLRMPGPPYQVSDGEVRNLFQLHLINKDDSPRDFVLTPVSADRQTFIVSRPALTLDGGASQQISVIIHTPVDGFEAGSLARLRVTRQTEDGDPEEVVLTAPLLGPRR
ncbi:MAG: cytochrome c oxidase accessory protein CcoG [Sandaracinaceae bacterium]